MSECVVNMKHIWTRFGAMVVHRDISLCLFRGERLGLVGGSGSGKTTLMREMIGLLEPSQGSVEVFGRELHSSSREEQQDLRNRCGVLFQNGALFTDLTVYDNVALPLREMGMLEEKLIRSLVCMKLSMVGLSATVTALKPAELSGGMVKRVALARALALEPELLFLDEPTSGLDPVSAENFVKLLDELHRDLNFSMVMITHDLHTLRDLCDRIAVLADGQLVAIGQLAEVATCEHPFAQQFFHGIRAARVLETEDENHG
ncbi:MAG: ATP-binding cassette domain-containing protein [Pseudomonadales bacterium]|nr:ATP-binding cassette domain-containing protein [Pseudomonadales bacterium]